MSSRIRTTEELRDALKEKLDELKAAFKADAVTLHLYDPQRERLYFPVGVNLLQERRFMQGVPSMERVTGKIVRSRMPIIAEYAEHHPDLTGPFTHVEKVKTAAGFPLVVPDSGEVMGVLFVDYRRPHQFEEDETERIQSQASELAEFISRSLQGDQGRMLRDALRMEADFRIEEARLQEIVDRLWDILGDVDIALWTQERGKRGLRIKMHAGMNRDFVDRVSINLDTDSSNLVSVAFVDGREVLIESPQTDPGAIFNVASPVIWQRMLAVPVSSRYRRLGVLCAFRRERLGFTRRERDLVRAFANLIAVTIENEDRIIALSALHDMGVRLTLATNLGDIMQEVVRSACQVIGADVATVHLYDPARQEFYDLEHSVVFPPEARSDMEKPRGKGGLSARIIEQGRIYCEDIGAQEDLITLSTFVREQGVKAYVGTPLISIDEPLGVLYVSFKEKRHFSPEDLALIQILANYASTAIYRARLLDQRTAVTEIARDITSELDRGVLLQKMLERSLRLLDCEVGSIALPNRATGELEFEYAIGKKVGIRLPIDKGLMTAAVRTRQPVRVGDVTKDPRYCEHVEETRSELDVPLLVGGELVGVLNVESPRYNAFSEEDEKLATTLASQAAVALYNAALFERRKALVDFGQAVASGIRLREDEVLELIYDQAGKLMDTDNMYIALYDEATDTVRFGLAFVDSKHVDVEAEEGWQPRRAGKGKTEEIIRTKKPLFHATKAKAEEWYAQPEYKEYIGGPIFGSWLGVPMTVGEKVVGVIATYHPTQDYVYSSDDLGILQAMANQAAIALDNAHMFYDVNRRLGALVEFGQAVTSGIRLREDEVLELIYKQASELMDTNNAYIALYAEATDIVRFGLAFVDSKHVDVETEEGWRPRRAGKGKTEEIIRTKKPLFHAIKAEAEAWYDQPEHEEYVGTAFASWLGVPMTVGEKVLGVIATYHPTRDYVYSGDDLEILQAMANQAAIALDNAHLLETEQRWADQLKALHEVSRELTASLDPERVWWLILEKAAQLTGAHYSTLQIIDEATEELVLRLVYPTEAMPTDETFTRIPIGRGITGWVAQHKEPLLVPDVTQDNRYLKYLGDTRSELAVPLIIDGHLIGVLNVEHREVGGLDEQDLELLTSFAGQAVIAIQNAQRYEEREEALIALREEQTKRLAAEKWQTLGQATTNLAHRMNNLAGIIPVCVQRIRERTEHESTVVKNLDMIEQQAKFLLRLSADLLRPFTPSALRKFDVNTLMREAVAITHPMLEERGIELVLHWGENIPKVRIRGLLSEAFVELITNAAKAMPEGGKLTNETRLSDDNIVEIVFTDTGCGIPVERQGEVFELFGGRREPTKKPEDPAEGIGFGLWWVSTFLQQWDGDVTLLRSEVGKGSTFVIRLPVEG